MARKGTKKQTKPSTPETATLRWLRIHQFRHVDPCELRFSETYNVLLGLNGTGKTTLLELIAAALRFDFSKMKKEAFFIEYEIALPNGTLVTSVRNAGARPVQMGLFEPQSFRPSFEVVLSNRRGERRFAARTDDSGVTIEVEGRQEKSDSLRADTLHGPHFLFLLLVAAVSNARRPDYLWSTLGHVHAEWRQARRFDEALGFLRTLTGASTRIDFKDTGSSRVSARGPVPRSILKALGQLPRDQAKPAEPVITLTEENVELLAQIATMLGFKGVEMRLSHVGTDFEDGVERRRFGDIRFMLERDDGSLIPHKLLSYGQKRALSFLCYLDVSPATVIADELVDGLHHLWIVDAIKAIGSRQAFLASQNPLLLDYLEFDSADKVQRSFIQCRLRKDEKRRERMVWANLSEYDAGRFFDAYQVGLQHVSEILRTKGLW